MVLPGMGSTSPFFQSASVGCAISAGESCASGVATGSQTGAEKCRGAISDTFLASDSNICQSDFDSQHGGTAAESGWMKLCMSVVFRSAFSYQVAAGSTRSEYNADVS